MKLRSVKKQKNCVASVISNTKLKESSVKMEIRDDHSGYQFFPPFKRVLLSWLAEFTSTRYRASLVIYINLNICGRFWDKIGEFGWNRPDKRTLCITHSTVLQCFLRFLALKSLILSILPISLHKDINMPHVWRTEWKSLLVWVGWIQVLGRTLNCLIFLVIYQHFCVQHLRATCLITGEVSIVSSWNCQSCKKKKIPWTIYLNSTTNTITTTCSTWAG
jgi:hypothetical protein